MRNELIAAFLLLSMASAFCVESDNSGVAVDATNLPLVVKCKASSIDGPDSAKLRRFEVLIEALPNQELNAGIRLSVTLHNKSGEALVIENPVDYFTYTLRNSAGADNAIPRPAPRGEATSLKGPREPRKLAFWLMGMSLNGQKMEPAAIDEDTIKLPPDARLNFVVLIKNMLTAPLAKPDDAQIGALAPGRYALKLRVAILLHHEDGTAWFDSPLYDDAACVRIKIK